MAKIKFQTYLMALVKAQELGELRLPYDTVSLGFNATQSSEIDRDWYEKTAWNPPLDRDGKPLNGFDADPNASPKPAWETIELYVRRFEIGSQFDEVKLDNTRYWSIMDVIEGHDFDFGIGSKFERLTSLVHILDRVQAAGKTMPRAVMQGVSDGPVELWTEASLSDFLEDIAARKNNAESAGNIVHAQFAADIKLMRDENGGLPTTATLKEKVDARAAAESRLTARVDRYAELFSAALADVLDETVLPTKLPLLKSVLIERLEAASTGQQKRIKGALSQQAIDNWAACVEVDEALQEVALECAVGVQRISVAADGEKAQAAFSAAVTSVKAVSPVNIPEVSHAISGRRVTIRAVNPTVDPAIRGPVSVVSTGVASTDGSSITGKITASDGPPVKDSDPMLLRWDFAEDYGGKVRIAVEVRNVCGPATFAVDLEVTANGGIRKV